MEKEFYFIINGIKYYPVHVKNALKCYYCAFSDSDLNCKLKNTGIRCEVNCYFVKK